MATFNLDLPELSALTRQLEALRKLVMTNFADLQTKAEEIKASNTALEGEVAELRGKLDNMLLVGMTTKDALEAARAELRALGVTPAQLDQALATLNDALAANARSKAALDAGDAAADEGATLIAP